MQGPWTKPFLLSELEYLLQAGFGCVGWRVVNSEAFGVPNPKDHVYLVATATPGLLVDCVLFSTVACPDHTSSE